jgi:hypothetical protein
MRTLFSSHRVQCVLQGRTRPSEAQYQAGDLLQALRGLIARRERQWRRLSVKTSINPAREH